MPRQPGVPQLHSVLPDEVIADFISWVEMGAPDPRVGKALSAIHDMPARDWTVESLAARSGLSRSAFAVRFSAAAGQPLHRGHVEALHPRLA